MSAGVDQQRTSAKGQALSDANKNTNADVNYVPQHQIGYTAAADGVTDPYGLMQGYYPYYAMTADDMTSGTMWSTGYNPVDYTSMMADYSYSGYGWLPHGARVGASASWDTTGLGTMKDEGSNSAPYATAAGYYTAADVMPMYGTQTLSNGQDHGNVMNTLEQGLQAVSMDDSNVGSISKPSMTNGRPSGGSKSWATVASQPAHSHMYAAPRSRSLLMSRNYSGAPAGGWDMPRHTAGGGDSGRQAHEGWMASRRRPTASGTNYGTNSTGTGVPPPAAPASHNSVDGGSEDSSQNQYNPKEFDLSPKAARFFIIKSYAEDDIHRSIKYRIWCSTEYGNKRLDAAYRERQGKGPIYLFFSVNGSGHFCGVAQMMSPVDYQSSSDVWAQDKWKGKFEVKWIYIKDVPNSQLRHIRLENNEGKPVTNSRDTQEVPADKGCQVLRVIHQYRHTTSIFDDFAHYESRQNDKNTSKRA